MDAGISGDYPAIMRFVNSLERDPIFFIIRAMSFTGQQGGLVNLRLRVSTWLRPADAAASGLPFASSPGEESPAASAPARRANNHGSRSRHRKQAPGDCGERAPRHPGVFAFVVYRMFFGSSSPTESGPAPVAPALENPPAPTGTSSGTSPAHHPPRATRRKTSPTQASIPLCTLTSWRRAKTSNTPARAATSSPPSRRHLHPQAPRACTPWPRRRNRSCTECAASAAQAASHRPQILRLLRGRRQGVQSLLRPRRRHLHGQDRRDRRPSLQGGRHPPAERRSHRPRLQQHADNRRFRSPELLHDSFLSNSPQTHPRLRTRLRPAFRHLPHGAPRHLAGRRRAPDRQSIQRDRDLETFHRGMQYRRAIQLYYRKFHAYPPNADALVKTNDIRFLRKKYKDPITGKDDWKPLFGQNKTPTAMGFFGQPLAGNASTLAGIGPSGGGGLPGGTNSSGGFPGGSSSGPGSLFGSSDSGNDQSPSAGATGSTDNSGGSSGTTTGTDNSGSAGSTGGTSSGGTSSTGTGSPSSSSPGGPTFGGAGIIGFSPASPKTSILVYKKKQHYNEWEFTYDPLSDMKTIGGGNTGRSANPPAAPPPPWEPPPSATPGSETRIPPSARARTRLLTPCPPRPPPRSSLDLFSPQTQKARPLRASLCFVVSLVPCSLVSLFPRSLFYCSLIPVPCFFTPGTTNRIRRSTSPGDCRT